MRIMLTTIPDLKSNNKHQISTDFTPISCQTLLRKILYRLSLISACLDIFVETMKVSQPQHTSGTTLMDDPIEKALQRRQPCY